MELLGEMKNCLARQKEKWPMSSKCGNVTGDRVYSFIEQQALAEHREDDEIEKTK